MKFQSLHILINCLRVCIVALVTVMLTFLVTVFS